MFQTSDLPLLAVFAAVVRRGSFTAAGRQLGLAKSVVSDRLRLLEAHCGVRLLERTTRRLRVTQAGEQVLQSADRLQALEDEVRAATEAQRAAPTGTLRVAASLELGARFVAPTVAALCASHPELQAELHFSDEAIDPVALGVDAALRLGQPKDSSFVARRLMDDEEVLVASAALAQQWSRARRPRDLAGAGWVEHLSMSGGVQRFSGPRGATDGLAAGRLRALCSNADAMRCLLREGVGFAAMPRHLVADELRAGRLVQVLPGWIRRRVGVFVLLPSRKNPPRRVSLFVEAITRAVRDGARLTGR